MFLFALLYTNPCKHQLLLCVQFVCFPCEYLYINSVSEWVNEWVDHSNNVMPYFIWRRAYFYFNSTIESMSHFDWLYTDSSNADGSWNFIFTKRCLKGNLYFHPPIASEREKNKTICDFICMFNFNWIELNVVVRFWVMLNVSFCVVFSNKY